MKKIVVIVVLSVLAVCQANAGINWFNNLPITYANGTTPLIASIDNASVGCFVQLIYAGANGVIDGAVNSGVGTTVDDTVVAFGFFGQDDIAATDGIFPIHTVASSSGLVTNGLYFARAWSAPSENFSSGLVPTSGTNFYGNSATWSFPGSVPPALDDDFDFTSSGAFATTLSPIPEPAMLGLGIVGLISLRFFGRKRK